jgi:hypothetical protein
MDSHAMNHDLAVKSQACEKYLLGELSPDLRDAYEEHYFSCAECATQLRIAAELIGAGQRIFAEAPAALAHRRAVQESGGGWLHWFRPAFAIPVLAGLLLIVGYQNLVTIPQLKESRAPRVLPMFSLIATNTRGETMPEFVAHPDEPIGLYVDVPADPAYSAYDIRLQDPTGKTTPLRSVSYAEAQKTQVVIINPGRRAGNYVIVVSGLAGSGRGTASAKELARLQFTVEFRH